MRDHCSVPQSVFQRGVRGPHEALIDISHTPLELDGERVVHQVFAMSFISIS
jgi:hypothetical protein